MLFLLINNYCATIDSFTKQKEEQNNTLKRTNFFESLIDPSNSHNTSKIDSIQTDSENKQSYFAGPNCELALSMAKDMVIGRLCNVLKSFSENPMIGINPLYIQKHNELKKFLDEAERQLAQLEKDSFNCKDVVKKIDELSKSIDENAEEFRKINPWK